MVDCTTPDYTAIANSTCKCASTATTNECAVGKFCYDSTCNDAAKMGLVLADPVSGAVRVSIVFAEALENIMWSEVGRDLFSATIQPPYSLIKIHRFFYKR